MQRREFQSILSITENYQENCQRLQSTVRFHAALSGRFYIRTMNAKYCPYLFMLQ